MDIHGLVIALAVDAPDLVQQFHPGKGALRVGQQLVQQFKLLGRQGLHLHPPTDRVAVHIHHHIPHRDLMLIHDAGPAEQSLDAEQQLGLIRRLGHIVIRAHQKTGVLVLGQGLGRQHQDGHHAAAIPDGLGQGKAIHFRHHHIAQQQVNVLVVDDVQRRFAVEGRDRFVAVDL